MKKDVFGILILLVIIIVVGWSAYRSDRANEGGLTTAPTQVEDNMTMQQDVSEFVTHTVTMATSGGDVTLELYGALVPNTVNNFVALARDGFYDDTRFHRIIDSSLWFRAVIPNTKAGEGKDIPLGMGRCLGYWWSRLYVWNRILLTCYLISQVRLPWPIVAEPILTVVSFSLP